jgi:hypothetical protein
MAGMPFDPKNAQFKDIVEKGTLEAARSAKVKLQPARLNGAHRLGQLRVPQFAQARP